MILKNKFFNVIPEYYQTKKTAFPLYALLMSVGKSRISDLWSKILTFGKTQINLVFRSLIRTFAPAFENVNRRDEDGEHLKDVILLII